MQIESEKILSKIRNLPGSLRQTTTLANSTKPPLLIEFVSHRNVSIIIKPRYEASFIKCQVKKSKSFRDGGGLMRRGSRGHLVGGLP
jgi:hypothetical protein